MDLEALESRLHKEQVEVRLLGETFTLNALTVAEASPIQREYGKRLAAAGDDESKPGVSDARSQAMIDSMMDAVEACLVEEVPRRILERVVVQTGMVLSPLMSEARRLAGLDWSGDEEDPDRDLPT